MKSPFERLHNYTPAQCCGMCEVFKPDPSLDGIFQATGNCMIQDGLVHKYYRCNKFTRKEIE